MKNKAFSFFDVAIIVIITSVIMYFLGGILIFKHLGGINYDLIGADENLKEFISAYNGLLENYYDNLNRGELIEGAINGMYSQVQDPYTTYMDIGNTNSLNESLSGAYRGIGIRIEELSSGELRITDVFDDSPAASSGLQVGDIITGINGSDAKNLSGTEIAAKIKESTGDKVHIIVDRNGSPYTFDIDVEDLFVPVVTTKLLMRNNHSIGYIKLSVFNDTADVQFSSALSSLENSGMEYLVIDLRNNTGGYLEVAKNIAEMFIEKGKIIYSLESKTDKSDYMDKTNEQRNYKVAVLVNRASASASEILTGALKYSYGAIVTGEKTYGKGKVQERASLANGTTVKYTTAKWYMPNGECIDGIGISPDYEIIFDKTNYYDDDIYSDNQVLYTLDYLID